MRASCFGGELTRLTQTSEFPLLIVCFVHEIDHLFPFAEARQLGCSRPLARHSRRLWPEMNVLT